jgi:hypothetical protein
VAAKLEVSDVQASNDLLRVDLDLGSEIPKRELELAIKLIA